MIGQNERSHDEHDVNDDDGPPIAADTLAGHHARSSRPPPSHLSADGDHIV